MVFHKISPPVTARNLLPNSWDIVALVVVIGVLALIAYGAHTTTVPITALDLTPVKLDPANLPEYALRTILRMLAAIVFSLIFTFGYATLAAKSRRAELVLIPLLDILQSVPILGFLTFTVVFFMGLFPHTPWLGAGHPVHSQIGGVKTICRETAEQPDRFLHFCKPGRIVRHSACCVVDAFY